MLASGPKHMFETIERKYCKHALDMGRFARLKEQDQCSTRRGLARLRDAGYAVDQTTRFSRHAEHGRGTWRKRIFPSGPTSSSGAPRNADDAHGSKSLSRSDRWRSRLLLPSLACTAVQVQTAFAHQPPAVDPNQVRVSRYQADAAERRS